MPIDKQRLGTFILGGIAGALAGILFAPKSGKELRGSITSRAGEARERSREGYFEAQERMQERIAEARERSLRLEESRTGGTAAEPGLGAPVPPGPRPPAEGPTDIPPPLRDVSWNAPQPVLPGEDPEEIRRRIQETRSRLRARLDAPKPEEAPEDHDG